jgi:hypothetical protein
MIWSVERCLLREGCARDVGDGIERSVEIVGMVNGDFRQSWYAAKQYPLIHCLVCPWNRLYGDDVCAIS